MKARVVQTKIWNDEWFYSISRSSTIVFLYLLTCPENNICGIFELSDRKICFETRVSQKELELAKKELVNKVTFFNGWVKIVNSDKYQCFTGEKNERAKEKELFLVPQDVKDTLSIPYRYPIDSLSNKYSVISKGGVGGEEPKKEKGFEEIDLDFVKSYFQEKRIGILKTSKYFTEQDIIDDWRDFHLAKGTRIKDFKASFRTWVKNSISFGQLGIKKTMREVALEEGFTPAEDLT